MSVSSIGDARSPLSFARRYARIGWRVFPLWWAQEVDGQWRCACGQPGCKTAAKHPISAAAPQGQNSATTELEQIERWWRQYPQANIAVLLASSNLVAIDIDPRNGGLDTIAEIEARHGPLESDVLAFTGGGGEHRVFSVPAGQALQLPGKLGPGVDVKHNGYIVVEPSTHVSGRRYAFEASSDPLEGAVASPLPDWIRDLARAAPASEVGAAAARAPLPDGEIDRLRAALAVIPSDDRETWLRVGMAVHNDVGGQDGFALWDSWSQSSAKYDCVDQMRVWRSFRRRPMGEAVQLPTIWALAYDHGFKHQRHEPAGAGALTSDEVEALTTDPQIRIVDGSRVGARPMPVTSLNEIVAWASQSSAQTHVLASQAAALAIMSACASRRYVSEHGDPAHVFIGVLAPTVSQVRYALHVAEQHIMSAGLRSMVRGQRFTSPAQLYAAILRNPSTLYLADDWGDQLRFARRQPSGLLEQALSILSGRVHAGQTIALDNWAELGLKPDRGQPVLPTLFRPSMSLLAAVAQAQMASLFKRSEFARGALDSMLLVPTIDGDWVDRPAARIAELPAVALEAMRALRGFEPGQTEPAMDQLMNSLALQEPTPIVVRFVADIQSVERTWIERAARLPLSARALALGARRTLRRLCTAMAAWANPREPAVTPEVLAWCNAFVGECLQVTLEEFELLGTDDDDKPDAYQALLDAITRVGPCGIPRRDLHKVCKPYRKLGHDERGKLLDAMVSDQVLYTIPTVSGRGVNYVAGRFVQEVAA
ncbi:MAG: bifunctional DNA primase/polymerase [Tessaracoccus sp.]|uniref:bifunctional DNA primase/polymerase n=1 Tax=Tessaracoccus sp. TaxID=1971211 RepID=UPI001EBE8AFB|nr:bifunctional DNA primase/polymerase [Tessaracoccus sp.]MBK7822985.1 bifunctional DNA primase/polymerase [Tessaracoccus sp.]